jgi:hypothetical protein
MPFEWIQSNIPSGELDGIPNEDFPMMVLWYGALHAKLDGKTRRVQVAFQRVDDRPGVPFFRDIAFSHLDALQLGSVWQRRRRVGEAKLVKLEPTAANFSPEGWRITSAKAEADAGRPAPLNGKYPVFHEDERQERSKLLELSLLDGRKMIVPCMEFLLRSYGVSGLIPRALTSMDWDEALGRFLTHKTPETNEKGEWVVRLAHRMQNGDATFLGHIQHVIASRRAAQGIVQQCMQQNANRQWIHLQVAPWFSASLHVSAKGIWVRPGIFLALRFQLNADPEASGTAIEVVKTKEEDAKRSECEDGDNVAREGNPLFTLSPESKMVVRALGDFDNTGMAPPETKGDPERRLILGPRRKITVRFESKPSFVIPPQSNGAPAVKVGPTNATAIAEAHRMVVAHGTVLEMWRELRRLHADHRDTIRAVEWLHVENGFVSTETPELVALQPFANAEPATPDARKFVTRDIKHQAPRGVLVVRIRVRAPDSKEWKVFYLLEIERRRERVKKRGTIVDTEESGCRGLVATLAPETEFRGWLLKTLSSIRHVVGRVDDLKSTHPDELVTLKHRTSQTPPNRPLRTAAVLVFTKARVPL